MMRKNRVFTAGLVGIIRIILFTNFFSGRRVNVSVLKSSRTHAGQTGLDHCHPAPNRVLREGGGGEGGEGGRGGREGGGGRQREGGRGGREGGRGRDTEGEREGGREGGTLTYMYVQIFLLSVQH